MSMTQSNQPRSGGERSADTEYAARREFVDTTRRNKAKRDSLHPSLRALPDYPVR